MEEAPALFRCPISMELMETPVTVATGVTYEKKNIERWLFAHKKSTCPATMQRLETFDLIPNHTLQRLIISWLGGEASSPRRSDAGELGNNLSALLSTIESSPFKVSSLKKLQSAIADGDETIQDDFARLGGIQVLGRIMGQVAVESTDFDTFRACEEALGVLRHLPLTDEDSVKYLSRPECVKPMMIMLQRGGAEARLHTMIILQRMSGTIRDWSHAVCVDEDIDIFKSLLELSSDEISTKLSSSSLDVLIEIVAASKKNRIKAIEAGAVCVLIEILPDATRHKCERIMLLLKMLCELPEGRAAFVEHGLGIAVVSKKIMRVSEEATKLGVKLLWLICSFMPTDKALDDMILFGSVRKLLGLLHMDGQSSTKEKALKIIKLHAGLWRHYPCFPCEMMEFLRSMH